MVDHAVALPEAQASGGRRPTAVYDSAERPPAFLDEVLQAWSYRDLVVQLVARDIKVRYKRSVLGVGWTMLNPLLMMVVLTLVFSHLWRFEVPYYPVYLLSAMVLWSFFAQSTTAAMSQLLWGGALLNTIYVPRAAFALAAIGAGLVNLVLSLVPLAVIMLATGVPLTLALLWLPVPIVLTALFALGVGLLLSALAVGFRDLVDMYQILLTAWYFLTPIIYPPQLLPEDERWWLLLNPMYYLVEAFRAPIYSGTIGEPATLVAATAIALAALAIGWWVFAARTDDIGYRL
jgi:ABC-type polysaccharide/polyol phosphate export permease